VYHLVLVTSGKGHFRLGDRLVPVSRGVLVTTGPGDPHCFERTPSESTGYAEATFDFRTKGGRCLELPFSGMLASWLGRPSPCRPVQMISEPATQALERTLQNVVRSGFSSEQVPLRSSCALMRVLEECHWATCRPPAPAMPWEKARLFLLEHYASDVSIASLAGRLGVHPDYLTRSFRRAYGMAPLAFQNSLRLEAAKSWLLSTDYPLKEIADRAGFQDAGYFGRLFRKRAGMTPGRFRKAKRAGR
jgi:AraC-like DNA-binding protein